MKDCTNENKHTKDIKNAENNMRDRIINHILTFTLFGFAIYAIYLGVQADRTRDAQHRLEKMVEKGELLKTTTLVPQLQPPIVLNITQTHTNTNNAQLTPQEQSITRNITSKPRYSKQIQVKQIAVKRKPKVKTYKGLKRRTTHIEYRCRYGIRRDWGACYINH